MMMDALIGRSPHDAARRGEVLVLQHDAPVV